MKRLLPIWLALLLLPGCLYTNVIAPLDDDLNQTRLGNKVGRSTSRTVLYLVAWGDAGTQAAAADGQITTINHADVKFMSILGGLIYGERTTIVYGD